MNTFWFANYEKEVQKIVVQLVPYFQVIEDMILIYITYLFAILKQNESHVLPILSTFFSNLI